MMNSKAKYLFEHYRQNLNGFRNHPNITTEPDRDDIVVCPLCFQYFELDALEGNELTIEHVPPRALGGKAITLTCKSCNNEQGSSIDSKLVSYIHDRDALEGHGEHFLKATFQIEDGLSVPVNIRLNETVWQMWGIPKASHPEHVSAIDEKFKRNEIDKFNLSLYVTNPRRARLGLLRAAYLLAFAHLGYGFVINPNLSEIRRQLQNPDKDIFPGKAVVADISVPDDFLGINIIYRPIKSYFVVFDVQDSVLHRMGVLLPGPNPSDYEVFTRLDGFESTRVTFRHFDIEFQDKLERPFISHDIWRSV